MFTHAITIKPGDNFAHGITTSNHGAPSYELIMKQHEAYVKTLRSLGLAIIELDVSEVRKMDGGLTCMSLRF